MILVYWPKLLILLRAKFKFDFFLKVSDLIKECRLSLAESLFVWTCQSPLSKDDTLILISYLEKVTVEADGSLDSVNLSLLMALLYCFDVSFLEQGTEDQEGKSGAFLRILKYG